MSPIGNLNQAGPTAGVLTGRFRRVNRLDDDEAGNRAVARAVTRAKQGDSAIARLVVIQPVDPAKASRQDAGRGSGLVEVADR